MAKLNFGPRLERWALRPPELDAKIELAIGAVRSGKTWATFPKLMYACRYPVGGRRIITGVSKSTVKTNILSDLADLVGPRNYDYNNQTGVATICGVPWQIIGMKDAGSEKYLRGSTIGYAVCDEVTLMHPDFWRMLLSRLSPPGARLVGTTNCDSPAHWLKTDYLDNPELVGRELRWDTYTMEDNPNLSPEYVASQKRMYTGVFYRRMILAEWVSGEGAIYGDVWGPQVMYDDATLPIGLYGAGGHNGGRVIAADYGTINPFVALDMLDDGRTVWVDREMYWDSRKTHRQRTDMEHLHALKEFIATAPYKDQPKIIVDPSAASFIAACRADGGLWVVPADNAVPEGLRRVASALQQRKLRVHARCENLEREMLGYSWNTRSAKLGNEEPLKEADHAPDALRYAVNDIFKNEWRLAAA